MDPMTLGLISLGVQGVPALFQGISGFVQKNKANKELEKLKYPMRPMSSGITAAKDIMTQQANMDQLPGQSLINSQLDQAISSQLGSATRAGMSSQDLMALASQLGEARMGQGVDMGVQAAGMQQQNKANLANFLSSTYAQEQRNLYENNILNPYLMKQQALNQDFEAGRENINAAVNTLGSATMSALPYLAAGNDWNKLSMLLGGDYTGGDNTSTLEEPDSGPITQMQGRSTSNIPSLLGGPPQSLGGYAATQLQGGYATQLQGKQVPNIPNLRTINPNNILQMMDLLPKSFTF